MTTGRATEVRLASTATLPAGDVGVEAQWGRLDPLVIALVAAVRELASDHGSARAASSIAKGSLEAAA